jgi:hypothetical protein
VEFALPLDNIPGLSPNFLQVAPAISAQDAEIEFRRNAIACGVWYHGVLGLRAGIRFFASYLPILGVFFGLEGDGQRAGVLCGALSALGAGGLFKKPSLLRCPLAFQLVEELTTECLRDRNVFLRRLVASHPFSVVVCLEHLAEVSERAQVSDVVVCLLADREA